MRAVRAWTTASERAMQAAVRPSAHTVMLRPVAAWQQQQQFARHSLGSFRGFYDGLAAAAPQTALPQPKQRPARMLSAAAAAPDVEEADVSSGRIFTDVFDPDYENFVAITGTMSNLATSASGDFSFMLRVKRRQPNQQPGEPDIYDSFIVDAPAASWHETDLTGQLQQDMLLQINGKLRAVRGDSGATAVRVLATDIGIMTATTPEVLVASRGPGVTTPAVGDNPSAPQAAAAPSSPSAAADAAAAAGGSSLPAGVPSESSDEREAAWIQLFQNPTDWYDNRATKKGRQPDFRIKAGDTALWIEDRRTPAWVFDNLQLLPGNKPYTGDYRPSSGGSSSSSSSSGKSFGGPRQLDFLPAEAQNDKEAAWMDVFQNYRNWWDNRLNKLNPRAPDFKHKTQGTALWFSSKDTPQWVQQNIEDGLPKAPPPRQ